MNFNLTLLETVTEIAKAKASGQAAWVRAIEKAAEQLITNPYICEKDGGLLILSYSGETYHANGACQCKAYANGRPCWHRAAAKLVKRYNEAAAKAASPLSRNLKLCLCEICGHDWWSNCPTTICVICEGDLPRPTYRTQETEAAQVAAPALAVETAATDERPALIASIKAAFHRARPFASLEGAVRQVFGATAKLEELATDDLRRILAALTPPAGLQAAPTVRPVIAHNQALDACTKQRRDAGLDGWWLKRSRRSAWNGWEV